jgi:enterochelin esterase-like enzyme
VLAPDDPEEARVSAVRLLCATLLALALFAPAALAQAPRVEGPIPATAHPGDPSREYPFFASDDGLAGDGYVEREYFYEGTATRYNADGSTTATPTSTGHSFKTRMVVRRPASARRFNGTVIVEWYNVSNQYDQEVDWLQTHEHLVREGYAWVGVSAQRAGIHSATGLRAWNPDRYGSLDVTDGDTVNDDTLSFDVFTQAARAIENPRGADPLGNLSARRLLATGHSQSAVRLRTYYNSIHPLANVYDGFVMHGMFGNTQLRTDLRTPVFKLQSETDAIGFFGPTTRQPDTRYIRTWEVAGTTHGDWKLIVEHGPLRIRDVGAPPEDYPPSAPTRCAGPTFSRVPFYMVQNAAYDWLDVWAGRGTTPPSAPLIELAATTPPTAVRDADGNALGGIRLPQFAVPIATDSGVNAGPGFCFLHGAHTPFTAERLAQLYRGDRDYVGRIVRETVRNLAAGYIGNADAKITVRNAARVGVPARGAGSVATVTYHSSVLGSERRMQVYLPPGYATSRKRYPVLYLIHGGGDDDTGWLVKGNAKAILDEAIAKDAMKPMIVVMPDARVGTNLGVSPLADPFPRELAEEIVPTVKRRFRTFHHDDFDRAMAGLSLGGVQVLDTLLRYPGAFGHLSAWSTGWFPVQIAALEGERRLLRHVAERSLDDTLELRIGTSDFAYTNMTNTRRLFDETGIQYQYDETPGGHEWPVWQRYLSELVPRLFPETGLIER